MCQAITWTNVHPIHLRIYVALWEDKFINQIIMILTIIKREMSKLKIHNTTHYTKAHVYKVFIKIIEGMNLILNTHATEHAWNSLYI